MYDTDYSVFALMLFRRQSGGQSVLRVTLLCEAPRRPRSRWWGGGEKGGRGGGVEGSGTARATATAKGRAAVPRPQAGCG